MACDLFTSPPSTPYRGSTYLQGRPSNLASLCRLINGMTIEMPCFVHILNFTNVGQTSQSNLSNVLVFGVRGPATRHVSTVNTFWQLRHHKIHVTPTGI